ncbi:Uncharacterised protein [Oligella urethralis]|uniref:Uncharacterized protein n=1 Tax=Oligella urethralis TaxID=90245 RepID=A0A2X1UKM9_9BURK|nr:Uncharacterised protein [Oligella urethralis]
MTFRVLLQKSIVELEKLFIDSQNDQVILSQLENELKYRKTSRASKLLKRVETAQKTSESQSTTEITSPESPNVLVRPSTETRTSKLRVKQPPSSSVRPIFTLEESYQVLGVVSASSWEVIEQARRDIVERSRPDLIAELSEQQKERVRVDAYRANQAYAILVSAQIVGKT